MMIIILIFIIFYLKSDLKNITLINKQYIKYYYYELLCQKDVFMISEQILESFSPVFRFASYSSKCSL